MVWADRSLRSTSSEHRSAVSQLKLLPSVLMKSLCTDFVSYPGQAGYRIHISASRLIRYLLLHPSAAKMFCLILHRKRRARHGANGHFEILLRYYYVVFLHINRNELIRSPLESKIRTVALGV